MNEVTQLRACDVLEKDGIKCIFIRPEAGTVKTSEERTVPLHPHLLKMKFFEWARQKKGDAPLFYSIERQRKKDRRLARRREPAGPADPKRAVVGADAVEAEAFAVLQGGGDPDAAAAQPGPHSGTQGLRPGLRKKSGRIDARSTRQSSCCSTPAIPTPHATRPTNVLVLFSFARMYRALTRVNVPVRQCRAISYRSIQSMGFDEFGVI